MVFENVRAVRAITALGGVVAAVGGVMGWLPAPVALVVALGAAVLGAVLLGRAERARAAREPSERLWRRADGPWPAYDRRRSNGGAESAVVASAAEPKRDPQPIE